MKSVTLEDTMRQIPRRPKNTLNEDILQFQHLKYLNNFFAELHKLNKKIRFVTKALKF